MGEEGKIFLTERDEDIQWDFTKYRTYDYAIGRWNQIDPKADSLYYMSPYNGMNNNPIRYNDPNGDCPWCVGALVGLAVEYTSQVVGNVMENGGEITLDAFTNVDAADLATATVAGAATGGLSSMGAQFTKTAITGGVAVVNAMSEGVKASTDVDVSVTKGGEVTVDVKSVYTGDKSMTEAVVQFATGNLPAPNVSSDTVGEAVNAVSEYTVGAVKSVLEEGVNVQAKKDNP